MSLTNDNRKALSKFTSDEIRIALKLVEELEKVVELMYHLMEHEGATSFVLMLMSAKEIALAELLEKQKRKTDMLFEIDKTQTLYAMLCQDTQVDGGYHFGQRLIKEIETQKGDEIYCCALEIRSSKTAPKSVFFKLIEMFLQSQQEERKGEVFFKSLN